MQDIILLGAGASIEAGVPGAFEMTRRIVDLFEKKHVEHCRILKFAVGGLLFQQGTLGNNPFNGVNVEDLFNAIQSLVNRHNSEFAPFVSSWHPSLGQLERFNSKRISGSELQKGLYQKLSKDLQRSLNDTSNSIDEAFDNYINDVIMGRRSGRGPGKLIYNMFKDLFKQLANTPLSGSRFAYDLEHMIYGNENDDAGWLLGESLELMISLLADLVWIEELDKVSYLKPLLSIPADSRRTIASLNYDNAIELASTDLGITVDTGIRSWSKTGEFQTSENGVSLLKLHGSIDWSLKSNEPTPAKPLPNEEIEQVSSEEIKCPGFYPAVIFGQRNKLTAQGPFLELLRAFRTALTNADRLTIIGYSFRDEHINEIIKQWFNGKTDRLIRIINGPSFVDSSDSTFAKHLTGFASYRVQVISKYAREGIAECFCT